MVAALGRRGGVSYSSEERVCRQRGLPVLLRAPEVAQLLGLSRSKVYELVACGALRAFRPGGRIRVSEAEVRVYLERSRV